MSDFISQTTNNGNESVGAVSGSAFGLGQSFTLSEAKTIRSIAVPCLRINSPTDNVVVKIWDSAGTTLLATSLTVAASSIPTTEFPVRFNFADLALSAGTYRFSIRRSGAADATNRIAVSRNTANVYAGGQWYTLNDAESSWTAQTGDLAFKIADHVEGVPLANLSTAVAPIGPFKCATEAFIRQTTTIVDAGNMGDVAARTGVGQTFTPASTITVSKLKLRLRKVGAPADTLNVYLTSGNHHGEAGAVFLGSANVFSADLATVASWRDIPLSAGPVTLTSGTTYYITLKRSGAVSATNYYVVQGSSTSQYADGTYRTYDGAAWTNGGSLLDMAFAVCGPATSYGTNGGRFFTYGRDATTASTLRDSVTTSAVPFATVSQNTYPMVSTIVQLSGYLDELSDRLHIVAAQQNTTSTTLTDYRYLTIDLALDMSETVEVIQTAINTAMSSGVATFSRHASVLSRFDKSVVVLYNGAVAAAHSPFSTIKYARRTPAGVWTTAIAVDAGGSVNYQYPEIAYNLADDLVSFLWTKVGVGVNQRILTFANVLQPASAELTAQILNVTQAAWYEDASNGQIYRVVCYSVETGAVSYQIDSGTPTPSLSSFNDTDTAPIAPIRNFADQGRQSVHALYLNNIDNDLYVKSSTDHGASFGTGTNVFTAAVPGGEENLSRDGKVYTRGGTWVIPYIANDNGTWRYSEYNVRPYVDTSVWVNQDYRFRNDDGTLATATWMAAQNTAVPSIAKVTNFRLRMNIGETAGADEDNLRGIRLEYRKNGGAWTNMPTANTSADCTYWASANVTDGANDVTQHLSVIAGGFYLSARNRFQETGTTSQFPWWNKAYIEYEFCLRIGASAAGGDAFQFRIVPSLGGVAQETPTVINTPQINVEGGGPLALPLTTGLATIATPTITQKHALQASNLTSGLATISRPSRVYATIPNLSSVISPVGPFQGTVPIIARNNGTASQTQVLEPLQGYAQKFTVSGAAAYGAIARVKVRISQLGTPTHFIYAELRRVSPTGTLVATSPQIQPLPGQSQEMWAEFTFPGVTLSDGTDWFLVIRPTVSEPATNRYAINFTANLIAGSAYLWNTSLGVHEETPALDMMFLIEMVTGPVSPRYYVLGRDASSAGIIRLLKATDPDVSWASVSSNNLINPIEHIAAQQVGDIVHAVFSHNVSGFTSYLYYRFDLGLEELVSGTEVIQSNIDTSDEGGSQPRKASIAVRSDGVVVVLYIGAGASSGGNRYHRIKYARRATNGTWTANLEVDSVLGAASFVAPVAICGLSDRVHFFYYQTALSHLRHRTLNSANVLQTQGGNFTTNSPPVQAAMANGNTDVVVLCEDIYLAIGTSADVPSLAYHAVVPVGTSNRLYAENNGADLYQYYRDTDEEFNRRKSTTLGVSWGPDELIYPGPLFASEHSLSINQQAYQRGSRVVIPFAVNDNGTWRYIEDTTRVLVPVDACVASNLATGLATIQTSAISQKHALTATPLSTGLATITPATLAEITTWIEVTYAAVVVPYREIVTDALTTSPLATGLATVQQSALAQKQALAANALATALSAIAQPSVTQKHAFSATALATGLATLTQATLTQKHVLAASALTTSLATLTQATLTQKHALSVSSLATLLATLQPATLAQRHGLSANALSTGLATLSLIDLFAVFDHHRPIGDVARGNWTDQLGGTTDIYTAIDEIVPNDADYVRSSELSSGQSDTYEVALGPGYDPALSTGHYPEYRIRSANGTINLTVHLVQGTTIIASYGEGDPGTSFITLERLLSKAQADAITDYTDLRLRFVAAVP